jgi:uncharacterized protein (TIGR00255 family)
MPKSMTGFAKIDREYQDGRIYGEVRSLNNRYLEISLKLPKTEYSYEQRLRDLVKRHVGRGKVDITIKWERTAGNGALPRINEENVHHYGEIVRVLRERFGLKGGPTVEDILGFRDIIAYEENNSLSEDLLVPAFEDLLRELNREREREGRIIKEDLIGRLKTIKKHLTQIEKRRPATHKAHEERLREKLMEATKSLAVDEVRVLQELAIFMEKADISEELVRLKGHMENFRDTLGSRESIGRKLDFIIQEMVREVNTIGSKANDFRVSQSVIEMKVEIEKMREQVQNVE